MPHNEIDINRPAPARMSWTFAGATLLGAFLLFQVQPLIGKFILPWFGGAPAVWTACMLFFQVVLFAGYAYSHLIAGWLSLRGQAVSQCLLLLTALALLPITPADSWKPTDGGPPTWRILLLLAVTVGLPYFVLSTTSPLIQSWLARSQPGRAPYRLYSLSNVGSLAALLSYPFVFEPALDVVAQSRFWSWCFAGFAVLMGLCAVAVWRMSPLALWEGSDKRADADETISPLSRRERARVRAVNDDARTNPPSPPAPLPKGEGRRLLPSPATSFPAEAGSPPSWRRRAAWLLLPACASTILLATTNHVCQDVAVVPLLWIVPLSLYLLSFVLCFDHPRWYVRPLWAVPAVIGIAAVVAGDLSLRGMNEQYPREGMSLGLVQMLTLHFATLLAICMVCHGELVRLRPGSRHLTEFYLWLSGGGALGGVAVALAAPRVFTTFFEWNLGMAAAYLLCTAVLLRAVPKTGRWRTPGLLLGGFAAGGVVPVLFWAADLGGGPTGDERLVDRQRNFYGVVSVWELDRHDPRLHRLRMQHGAIIHGQQFLAADQRGKPYNYYTPDSGIGQTLRALQSRKPHIRVGVVGLGIGTLAAYARPGDRFVFYEINPAVRAMAENCFFYLDDARRRGAEIEIVMGDARLALEREESREFDLLVLDAFSGDSVPVHLLTGDAMKTYRRHVSGEGVLAFNATNSCLYLLPVVRALADEAGLGWRRVYLPKPKNDDVFRMRSNWVMIGGNESFLRAIPNIPPPPGFKDDFRVPAWTDRKNDLYTIIIGMP